MRSSAWSCGVAFCGPPSHAFRLMADLALLMVLVALLNSLMRSLREAKVPPFGRLVLRVLRVLRRDFLRAMGVTPIDELVISLGWVYGFLGLTMTIAVNAAMPPMTNRNIPNGLSFLAAIHFILSVGYELFTVTIAHEHPYRQSHINDV